MLLFLVSFRFAYASPCKDFVDIEADYKESRDGIGRC